MHALKTATWRQGGRRRPPLPVFFLRLLNPSSALTAGSPSTLSSTVQGISTGWAGVNRPYKYSGGFLGRLKHGATSLLILLDNTSR